MGIRFTSFGIKGFGSGRCNSESALGLSTSELYMNAKGVVVRGAIDYNAAYADAARDAIAKVSTQIADLSPLIGYVVTVDSDQVMIDVGEEQGVKNGDIFEIVQIVSGG